MITTRIEHPGAPAEPVGAEVNGYGGLIQVAVTLQGVTPLLMNAMSEQQLLEMRDKKKKPRMASKPKPREEAASKVHCLPDGTPCIPLRCLMATFINAGQFIRLDGKRQISTDKKTILPGMLGILDTVLPVYRPGTEDPAPWEVDIQQGRNPNGGEAVCLIRPRFDAWELRCTVEVDQDQMTLGMARELVDVAGRRVGLLEFRPQRKGTYGRFNVVSWVPVQTAPSA